MLHVTLVGNMGGDPELRYSQKGTQIASFSVAVNQVRRGPDGERQENTEWFRVKVSGSKAEYVQRFGKGNRVLVLGRLEISHYERRDGTAAVGYDVWADDVQNLSPRDREANGNGEYADEEQESVAAAPAPNARPRAPQAEASDLEDLPF